MHQVAAWRTPRALAVTVLLVTAGLLPAHASDDEATPLASEPAIDLSRLRLQTGFGDGLLGAKTSRPATADLADGGEDAAAAPVATVIGETRDFDQIAVEGEYHLGRGRFSVFAGVGYLPGSNTEAGRAPGATLFTGGGRVFTSGLRSRGFLQLSCGPQALTDHGLVYGPNLLLGYQRIARNGLTLHAGAGYGFGRSSERDQTFSSLQLRLGLGFTWFRGGR